MSNFQLLHLHHSPATVAVELVGEMYIGWHCIFKIIGLSLTMAMTRNDEKQSNVFKK